MLDTQPTTAIVPRRSVDRGAAPYPGTVIFPPPGVVDHVLRLQNARQRLIALYAVRATFSGLERDREWTRWIAEARAQLQPTDNEHRAILEGARRLAPLLQQELERGNLFHAAAWDGAASEAAQRMWVCEVKGLRTGSPRAELRRVFESGEVLITVHPSKDTTAAGAPFQPDPWRRSGQGYALRLATSGNARMTLDDVFDMYDAIAASTAKLESLATVPETANEDKDEPPLVKILRRRKIAR